MFTLQYIKVTHRPPMQAFVMTQESHRTQNDIRNCIVIKSTCLCGGGTFPTPIL